MWALILSVPDHCLSFYYSRQAVNEPVYYDKKKECFHYS